MGELLDWLHNPQLLLSIVTAIAVTATVVSVGLPLLERNDLSKRMRAVALERDKIRARERARLDRDRDKVALRQQQAKPYMQQIVEKLKLRQGLMTEDMRDKLRMAGFRSDAHVIAYLFARVVLPIALFLASLIYVFVVGNLKQPPLIKIGMVVGAAYVGYGTPLSQTLRVMAQENRDLRMNEAEKRAAALPPKLTVPMIVFFLPVLFVVILGPAAIKLMALD